MIGSCGESNTRCSAKVSSTTPRFGPRCPRGGNLVDQELTDLGGQLPKLRLGKVLQISGPADLLQHFASVRSNPHWPSMRPPIKRAEPL